MPDELGRFLACDELCGTWEPSGDRADRWYRRPRESDHGSRAAGRLHARRTWRPGQSRHHRRRSRFWARSPAPPDPGSGHRRERSWPKPAISRPGPRVRPQGPARRIPCAGSPAPRNAADAIDHGERSPGHGSAQHVVPRTRSAAVRHATRWTAAATSMWMPRPMPMQAPSTSLAHTSSRADERRPSPRARARLRWRACARRSRSAAGSVKPPISGAAGPCARTRLDRSWRTFDDARRFGPASVH